MVDSPGPANGEKLPPHNCDACSCRCWRWPGCKGAGAAQYSCAARSAGTCFTAPAWYSPRTLWQSPMPRLRTCLEPLLQSRLLLLHANQARKYAFVQQLVPAYSTACMPLCMSTRPMHIAKSIISRATPAEDQHCAVQCMSVQL